jgi:stearoyl-CoA desaturase (delta-9 desaturase)
MSGDSTPDRYDGTSSFPESGLPVQTPAQRALQFTVTGLIVAGPLAGLVAALWLLWGPARRPSARR